MSNDNLMWQTKLAARLHDPAEKALVLLRDPAGHENGTSAALRRLLGLVELPPSIDPDGDDALVRVIFKNGLPINLYRHIQRADWWASAADRPQWPLQEITITTKTGDKKTLAIASWAQVRWTNDPVLVHPLTGKQFKLPGGLSDTDIQDIKQRSFDHFSSLLVQLNAQNPDSQDLRKILLAFWRFGPELNETDDNGKLGELWKLLPADTRIPDHSIWDHLDLTSAFSGAFAADPDGEVSLLAISIGPVQGFIAAARKMEDLWAGSHLLSRLAWEAMKPVCETFGPDAILFPRLRGIPQVDLWLRDNMNLPDSLFKDCDWTKGSTDANPLFSASLPNRFVALIPASQARSIADTVQKKVREWLIECGKETVSRLLETAGYDVESTVTPYDQMQEQLQDFPEVHWAAIPFSLIHPKNKEKQRDLDVSQLQAAMAPFFGVSDQEPCGFLNSPAWRALQKDISWGDGTTFFSPNPGVLYPAVYDLAERVLAAAKTTRTFQPSEQQGWRCSLTGETEWLTSDRDQLQKPPGTRIDTLWSRISDKKPSWAKKGEHLGGLPAIKRLWPTIFAEEVGKALAAGEHGEQQFIGRFVVSTHTMALAHQLDSWLENSQSKATTLFPNIDEVALPRGLMRHRNRGLLETAKRIPGKLDEARDSVNPQDYEDAQKNIKDLLKVDQLESYYAMIMMDGDKMGAILSGEGDTAISYRSSFHPKVQKGFDDRAAQQTLIQAYGKQSRPVSPNRHLCISSALNDFSQTIARYVIEEEYLGRIIYSGGDDVLAMLPVTDLLPAMQRLRQSYSGHDSEHVEGFILDNALTLKNGFAALKRNERLSVMRMMGENATASCGAIIAHHQAPLSAVLRELRTTEKRAKNEGGRDAFSITIIKRSGGALFLTGKWGEPLQLLDELRDFLSSPSVSRRAVYNSLTWLHDLPDPKQHPDMLESLLGYQLARQSDGGKNREGGVDILGSDGKRIHNTADLARRLAELAARQCHKEGLGWLENFMSVAEFLAREIRIGGVE